MFGAVAVGMFHKVEYGVLIAAAHYLSSFTVGIIMSFYKRKDRSNLGNTFTKKQNILLRALISFKKAREEDGRPIGKLLGDAIRKSVSTMLAIGGFIILFSVLIRVLLKVGLVTFLAGILLKFLEPFGATFDLIIAYISGIFEVTIGCQKAATVDGSQLSQLVAVGFIIAFSGISVIAQVASMVSHTDLNIKPFVIARIIHGCLAAIYTYLLVKFGIINVLPTTLPVFLTQTPTFSISFILSRITLIFLPLIFLFFLVIILLIYKSIKIVWFTVRN
jgi:sporulation integral membrane protein YlbJ